MVARTWGREERNGCGYKRVAEASLFRAVLYLDCSAGHTNLHVIRDIALNMHTQVHVKPEMSE